MRVRNSFPLRPQVLNISLTERCNAACSMCCAESHPGRRDPDLDIHAAKGWLTDASNLEGIYGVCFIGGEPFLRFEALLSLATTCQDLGWPFSVVTNCFWARTPELAYETLLPLRNAGLSTVTMSTDQFHEPFVSPDRVDNALDACKRLEVRSNLNCVVAQGTWGLDHLRNRLKNFHYFDKVSEQRCLPVGFGKAETGILANEIPNTRCTLVISTLSLKSNGDLYACCGIGGFTPPLFLGNLHQELLAELIDRAVRDPLILALAIHGPGYLKSLLVNTNETQSRYADNCHLCNTMLSDEATVALLRERLAAEADHLSIEYAYLCDLEDHNDSRRPGSNAVSFPAPS